MPLIVCIGWGSLVWDPGSLALKGRWQKDGPELPVEFVRQSSDGRITLVIVPQVSHTVATLWAELDAPSVSSARRALREREKTTDDYIGFWPRSGETDPIKARIGKWAATKHLEGVVWTNLPPTFQNQKGRVPTVEEVIAYLSQLRGSARDRAEEYVRRAPVQIRTPYRTAVESQLGWTPI